MKTNGKPAKRPNGFWLNEWLKHGIPALALMLTIATAGAADFVSAQSGDWFNPATWGLVTGYPSNGDTVMISNIVYLTFTNALYLQVNNFHLSNGTLNIDDASGQGLLAMSGTNSYWTNSLFGAVGPGGAALQLGTLELLGNNSMGATFTNQGVMRQTDDGRLNIAESVLVNGSKGTYEFAGNGHLTATFGDLGDFYNEGLLLKSSGINTSSIAAPFHNYGGTIEVDSGTLSLASAGGASSNGTFIVAAGATLDIAGGSSWTGKVTGSGAGHVVLRGGTFNAGSSVTFDLPDDLFQWTGGNIGGTTNINLGVMTLAGTNNVFPGSVFLNAGLFRHTNTASLDLYGRAFDNLASGTYDLEGDGHFSIGFYGGSFNNYGTFRKSGGTGISTLGGNNFNNDGGTLEVDSGAMQFDQNYSSFYQTGGTTWLNGADIIGGAFNFNGGVLTGDGSVTGTVVNAGAIVSPGNGLGSLNITGAYQQQKGGALDITLGGTNAGEFNQLDVNGSASLAGALNLSLTNGYAPSVGDQFQILSCSSRSGKFSLTNQFPTGIAVNYSNTGVFLVVTGAVIWPERLAAPRIAGSDFDFGLQTVANQSYTVQRNDDLTTTNWVNFTNFTGDGSLMQFVVPTATVPQRFFRVREP